MKPDPLRYPPPVPNDERVLVILDQIDDAAEALQLEERYHQTVDVVGPGRGQRLFSEVDWQLHGESFEDHEAAQRRVLDRWSFRVSVVLLLIVIVALAMAGGLSR